MHSETLLSEYQKQLDAKVSESRERLAPFGPSRFDIFASAPQHYRMRAEFKAWHQDDKLHYAMYQPGETKKPYIVEDYPPGSNKIQSLMPQLLQRLNQSSHLKHKLFQIEFLTTTTNEALITLIYHKPLDESWTNEANALGQDLAIKIIGRSRKQKIVFENDFVIEQMYIANKQFLYQQVESSFTQPNAGICQDMLNWVYQHSQNFTGDLLELYCGNGNFTIPLSRLFHRVLATEISKASIKSALYNCELNQVTNIEFVRMSSEELTQALNGVRAFNRLKNCDLNSYQFSTVLVDPPRAGLDEQTNQLIANFDNIIYISCSQDTLCHDLETLCLTHDVIQTALFDQFPFTHHIESGVILRKKP